MKALHEIWGIEEAKVNLVAEYPFKLRGYTYTPIDIEAFKAMCQRTGTDPRQGEIYPQWDGYRFVPTLTSDGWLRIANEHPEFDGMSIAYSEREVTISTDNGTVVGAEFVEVTVHRKDRTHQSSVREYLREAFNEFNPTHYTHPNRNTRHKAIAQAVKIAFGISGAYVQGEAEALSAAVPEQGGPMGHASEQPAAEQQQGQSRRPRVQTKPLDNPPPVTVVEPKGQTQTEVDAKAQAEADAKAQAEADAKAQAEADAKAQAEADAKAQAEADAKAQAEADAKAQAEADAKAQAEADAKAQAEADAKAQAEADAKAEADADSGEPDFEPKEEHKQALTRLLDFTEASGEYRRAHEFLKATIKDKAERAWYEYHLTKLEQEKCHA